MAKESTLSNLTITLGVITLLSAIGLGGMQVLTYKPIEAAKQAKVVSAIQEVLPPFDNNPVAEMYETTIDGEQMKIYPAKANGELVGTAVESFSNSGFSGRISVMVGFAPGGEICGYSVLEQAETPGLGSKMVDWFKPPQAPKRSLVEMAFGFTVPVAERKSNIFGMSPGTEPLRVSKDGGTVDAITAATISSRAFLDAINRAYSAVSGNDADTGATPLANGKEQE